MNHDTSIATANQFAINNKTFTVGFGIVIIAIITLVIYNREYGNED